MPLRSEAIFLRERAKRLRDIAGTAPSSPLSPDLLQMAADLERHAADLERQQTVVEEVVAQRQRETKSE